MWVIMGLGSANNLFLSPDQSFPALAV